MCVCGCVSERASVVWSERVERAQQRERAVVCECCVGLCEQRDACGVCVIGAAREVGCGR